MACLSGTCDAQPPCCIFQIQRIMPIMPNKMKNTAPATETEAVTGAVPDRVLVVFEVRPPATEGTRNNL